MTTELKVVEVRHFEVDYKDLESFLCEVYDIPVKNMNLPYVEEWTNDSTHVFHIGGTIDNSIRVRADGVAERLKTGGAGWNTAKTLLEDLANRGMIPRGKYLIRVSW